MISGEKVVLTALERYDLPKNYLWGNDPELIHTAGMTPFPKGSWQIEQWYEQSLNNPNALILAVRLKENAEYIGNIELSGIDFKNATAEIGLIIGEKQYWRQGYAQDSLNALAKFAFQEMNLNRLASKVLAFNQPGLELFQKAGFKEEGKERQAFFSQGQYWDIHLFSRLRGEQA